MLMVVAAMTAHPEQYGVQYLAQGHFGMQTKGKTWFVDKSKAYVEIVVKNSYIWWIKNTSKYI